MRTSVLLMLVAWTALLALPAAAQDVVNGTFDQGLVAPVGATEANLSTALTGWTYAFNWTPIGNFYIGYNIKGWNQKPGYTVAGVGSVYHANPAGNKTANVTQTATGLQPGGVYNLSGWLMSDPAGGANAEITLAVQNPDNPGWTWSNTVTSGLGWVNEVIQVTASAAGTADIRIFVALGNNDTGAKSTPQAKWDDFSLTLVPEPGGVVAVLSGLVGLAGFAIRRRK